MKLYEIDNEIQKILDGMQIDEETGEVVMDLEAFTQLQMEREKKLEGIALGVKNLAAEAEAIRKEENKLAERRKVLENQTERLKGFLSFALNGEKLETARVMVTTRPGAVSTKIDDVHEVVDWYNAKRNALFKEHTEESLAEFDRITDLTQLVWPEPTVSKTGIKKLLKDYKIPGVELVTGQPIMTIK